MSTNNAPYVTQPKSSSTAPSVKRSTERCWDHGMTSPGLAFINWSNAITTAWISSTVRITKGPSPENLCNNWQANWVHLPWVCPAAYNIRPFKDSMMVLETFLPICFFKSSTSATNCSTRDGLLETLTKSNLLKPEWNDCTQDLKKMKKASSYLLLSKSPSPASPIPVQPFAERMQQAVQFQSDRNHRRNL